EGELLHPNDCAVRGEDVIVCDAGGTTPVIKRIDPANARVRQVYPIQCPGWRLASTAVDLDGSILTIAVEDRPLAERSRLLINRYDGDGAALVQSFTTETDNVYSQGGTVLGT